MFELTFADGKKRGMAFDAVGHAPVFVSKRGSQIMPGDWKRVRRAFDALPDDPGGKLRGLAGANLRKDLQGFVTKHGLDPEHHRQLLDLLNELLSGERQSDGATAVDDMPTRHKVSTPSAHDDEDEDGDPLARFRKYLKARGLDDEAVEAAVRIAERDRQVPAVGNVQGGEFDFGATAADPAPWTGLRPAELRPEPQFWNGGRRDPAERLPGGGVSRRLAASDAAPRDSIEQILAEYGGEHLKVGMFG